MLQARIVLLFVAVLSSPAQTFTTLIDFNWTNGSTPEWLGQGLNGKIYGWTGAGGTQGGGTVFRVTPQGRLSIIYNFCGNPCAQGSLPTGVVQGRDGNYYGTTWRGGTYGCGVVFKLTPVGALTVLYNFDDTHGCDPGWLIQGIDGNLYGTTAYGGAYSMGTVFKITPGGTLTSLHSFTGADGFYIGGLAQAANGELYGTASSGGPSPYGYGTIFKITPSGVFTLLHSFNYTDGRAPGPLLIEAGSNFYGITGGEVKSDGTIFKITPAGTFSTVHNFTPRVKVVPSL